MLLETAFKKMLDKRILITGVTGYLGSHLAKALVNRGCEVIGIIRSSSSLHRLSDILSTIELINIDNVDLDSIFRLYGKVDTIIHTATNYGRNNQSVSEIFAANTEFPLRLLDAGSRAGVKSFMNTDTILDKYLNLYAFSKNQLLEWGRFFALHKKIAFWNLRLEHFYGAADDSSKFTAQIINSCLANAEEILLTKGEQRRDFIYIDDVISAYMLLFDKIQGESPCFREFEVGSGNSITIKDFAHTVKHLTGASTLLNFGVIPYRDGEVMDSVANIEPLTALGWQCKYDIYTGIRKLLTLKECKS